MIPREQLRMTADELDAFLAGQRTLRLATVDDDGVPHVVPLWFVWYAGEIWVNSLTKSRRHRHLRAGRPVGLVVDDGRYYDELRGVRMTGTPEVADAHDPEAAAALELFAQKYFGGGEAPSRRNYQVVRIAPTQVASWDFRKIPAGADAKTGRDRR